ncbi:N-acetylglucosamine-6-phosphate deacetylase [Enteractinococcus fodinae]|uniref:N-acetylglucosamine-6-phosphate deacetylase n=1 Tax=Enteractinococcus fodinae TaxID=684663 RepID=A0ABU2B0J2_9MICC|nr:hypothetical protein [Enteractinococcus fodinae]MDR7346801.1 N-acetylglucosamine-6-phosphate deacetylase [Enteractinococcus fodinae]
MPTPDSSNSCAQTFIDRHIHGIAGVDFATSPLPHIRDALTLLATRRTATVTASLPTLDLPALSDACERLQELHSAGLVAGVHLEGPFLAPDFSGAHPHHALQTPNSDSGQRYLEYVLGQQRDTGIFTMMTLAPELPGAQKLIEQLVQHGIEPALGHTGANYEQMRKAISQIHALTGRPVMITHVYNAMRGFHHRDPGPLLAVVEAAQNQRVTVELIADGIHVDLGLVRWWFQHYPETVRLVSDASAATPVPGHAAIPDATFRLGHAVLSGNVDNGPRLSDGRTIASGGKDLLAIHDDLVAAGFDHALVCAAMR